MIARFTYNIPSAQCLIHKNGTLGTTLSTTGLPANSLSYPTYTTCLGRYPNNGAFQNGKFAEFIAFDRILSAGDLAIVDAELFATYGVHA